MSARDWRDLDDRLERAIDALNEERAPASDDPELLDLIDTARLVRQLRPPAEPDAGFAERLVDAVSASGTRQNGLTASEDLRQTRPLRIVRLSERRVRSLALVAAALRAIGICMLAGMLAGGLIGGLGGRAAMRVSGYMYERDNPGQVAFTQSSEEPVGQISLAGTWNLVVEVALSNGMFGGLMFLLVAPLLPKRRRARGIAYAALLLLASGWLVFDSENADFEQLGSPLLNIAMFGGLIFAFGLAVPWLVERLSRIPAASRSRGMRRIGALAWSIVTTGLGALGLLVLTMLCLAFCVLFIVTLVDLVTRFDALTLLSPLAILAVIALTVFRVASLFFGARFLERARLLPHYRLIVTLLIPLIALGGTALTIRSITQILSG